MTGNIEALMPQESETVKQIFAWHKGIGDAQTKRGYLGASSIGTECERALWYQFRQCSSPEFSGRIYRLFETGNLEEERFVRELKGIGCKILDIDPDTGNQFEILGVGGHFSGHMDGCVLGIPEAPKTWHVVEFKTHNAKSFAALKNKGVKESKPEHYAQMMVYMGGTGMKRAIYIARDKNTDDLYSERIKFDTAEYDLYMNKAERIIKSIMPPERMASRPDDWRCKFCDSKAICWGTNDIALPLPSVTCRTCCHATPEVDEGETWARWSCSKHKKDQSPAEVSAACPCHLVLPALLNGFSAIDATEESIEFESEDKAVHLTHGEEAGAWSTEELIATPMDVLLKGKISQVKEAFGGAIDYIDTLALVDRYPPGCSERLWDGAEFNDEALLATGIPAEDIEVTRSEDTDEHLCTEYNDNILVVKYKKHGNHIAIWRGVE